MSTIYSINYYKLLGCLVNIFLGHLSIIIPLYKISYYRYLGESIASNIFGKLKFIQPVLPRLVVVVAISNIIFNLFKF